MASSAVLPLFSDPRAGQLDAKHTTSHMLDLWRVHLQQCPECGYVHGTGNHGASNVARQERHIYEYTGTVPEDLFCALCGEVFQNPVLTPCGHHFCSLCVRSLLSRTAGRASCPLDGHPLTRFAMRAAETLVLTRLEDLTVLCPVCKDEIRKGDLQLHLQDPVSMHEERHAYDTILRPFYLSCPLSTFTVGEFNGSSSLIRFYRRLGSPTMQRFVLTTESFIVLPDPKMGFQPHTEEDFQTIKETGGYFNAWWVHPSFRTEVWWRTEEAFTKVRTRSSSPSHRNSPKQNSNSQDHFLTGKDCSAEPWAASSFVHTWSSVKKPADPKYICCLRDLTGADLGWLTKFRDDVQNFLKEVYNISPAEVSIFAHYPSSARYSTLHFHIIFGARFQTFARKLERPHQLSRQFELSDIVDHLLQDPDHFRKCSLTYFLGDKADLMDPISGFYGCSPHRYVKNFSFEWDPSVLPGSPLVRCDSSHSADVKDQAVVAGSTQVSQQLRELRHNLGSMRQSIDELRDAVNDLAKNQRLEQVGASRLALMQLAAIPESGTKHDVGNGNIPPLFLKLSLVGLFCGIAVVATTSLVRRK